MAKNEVITEDGEVLESKQVAISKQAASAVMIGGQAFMVARLVNVPTLKHESGETIAVRIDQPIFETENKVTEEVNIPGEGKRMIEKINVLKVMRVTELNSMQPFEYVCNAMTADNLEAAYPDSSYVGRMFAIQKLGVVAGKRYKEVNIVEIEPVAA